MDFKEGQEFISGGLSSGRHYKILAVNPILDYNRAGKKKITGRMLKVESLHVKREDWTGALERLYDRFRFFETTDDAFHQLVTRGVIKLKNGA